MGTIYERDETVQSTAEVQAAKSITIKIENIVSRLTIVNTLDIKVRQKPSATLSWVSIAQGSPSVITISPTASEVG